MRWSIGQNFPSSYNEAISFGVPKTHYGQSETFYQQNLGDDEGVHGRFILEVAYLEVSCQIIHADDIVEKAAKKLTQILVETAKLREGGNFCVLTEK